MKGSKLEEFRKVDITVRTDYIYEIELMATIPLAGNALHKPEMEYNGNFGHNLGRIQHMALISRIDICCETCFLSTQTVAPNIPGFQGINRCVQYLVSHPHKPIFYRYIPMMAQMSSELYGVGIKLNATQLRTV